MIRLQPQSGESQAEFCERCHKELETQIPETDRRNSVCLQMCRDAGMDAAPVQRFSEREFKTVRDVPVFAEHTTKDRDGNLVVYDRNALAAIADRCNERIADTGDYPPLTEGHTPTKEEQAQGAKMPDVLGYAGNFRLGQIGNKSPRWAIFCDEYHHQEDSQKLRKLRRRSPEVWLEERMEDRFFDPIAALGAETPRLDMGMARFGRIYSGESDTEGRFVETYAGPPVQVEKYTAVAPAPASTFVPGELGDDDEPQRHNAEGTAMLTPEDINQVVEALMQTEPMQFLQEQMAAAQPEEPEPGMPGEMPPADPGLEAPPAEPAAPVAPEPAPAYEPDEEDQQQFSRYMAGDCSDDEMASYAAEKRKKKNRFYAAGEEDDEPGDPDMTDSYEKRHAERIEKARYEKQEQRIKELEAKAAKADTERRKAERYSKLNDLRQEGVQLDPAKELERTEKFNDEQFEVHLDAITENYSRIPLDGVVPRIFAPDQLQAREGDQQKAKYAKAATDKALREGISFEAALESVKKESA